MDYKRVFGTEQGKRIMQELIQAHYIMQPVMNKDPLVMAFKEGQRNVVLRILNILETSEEQMHKLLRETHSENTSIT